ncbi:MAG: hypothetical protein JW787_00240 [Sedimentisphaerales bacterium]|nr:hypothetical protein [Sedimentisphaerales bacterium]
MDKVMSKREILFAGLIIIISFTPIVHAFVVTPKRDLLVFTEELKSKNVSELEKLIEKGNDSESDKMSLIFDELGNRTDSQSKDLLEKYAKKYKKEIDKSPFAKRPYTNTQINLAKQKSGGKDSDKYIDELEKLLISKNKNIQQDIVAFELSNTLTVKARNVLLKYEKGTGIGAVFRQYRLKKDFGNLDDVKFVEAILKSARDQIANGEKELSAERTILGSRMIESPFSIVLLEEEIKKPSLDNPVYRDFIRESLERMRNSENTYYLGFSELWERYKKKESGLLTDLEKIYKDDTYTKYDVMYREKAYEMYLTLQMERDGLNNQQTIAEYLLRQLKGTGDGHVSDYTEKGQKSLQAIEDVVRVRLLSRLGEEILPIIDKELIIETQEQRKEALTYIKKQIMLSKSVK